MSIRFGDSTPTNFYFGSASVSALYQGADLVWPAQQGFIAYTYKSQFDMGTGPFTIEWWQYRTALKIGASDQPRVFSYGSYESTPAYSVTMEGNTSFGYFRSQTATFFSTVGFDLNVWQHYAICRNSSNEMYYYKDGTVMQGFSGQTQGLDGNFTRQYLTIGKDHTGSISTGFSGHITNLHFLGGTCKYNGGGGMSPFTPPTTPITAQAGTRLLLLATNAGGIFTDSSTYATTIATSSLVQWSSLSPYAGGLGGSILFNA
jgi:hypothetical protein